MASRSKKTAAEVKPRDWHVGDRVRVARSLTVLELHVGKVGAICEVSPHADWMNNGRRRVFRVELDGNGGKWWYGSAELSPEYGEVEW